MTAISNNNIAKAIYAATKGKTHGEQSIVFPQIVSFLARRRLLSKSSDILSRLNKIINDDEGKVIARVSSVEKMTEASKKEITHSLSKYYGGKTVILEERLDPKLLGGYKIEVNDEVIDLSIKNRIQKLQEHLTQGA